MSGTTKIKAKLKDGIVEVKALATHPMLSYQEAERAKKTVNFITHITAKVGADVVFDASTSQFLSKDPYIRFTFKGAKDEEVEITWVDLTGATTTAKEKVK